MNETFRAVTRWNVAVVLAAGLAAAPVPLLGQDAVADQDSARPDPSPHSAAALIAETRSVQPGSSFTVGLQLTLEPGWHTDWRNPGDSGEAASITWRLPAGVTAGEIQWPAPQLISFPPLASYGYFDEVLLLVEISTGSQFGAGDSLRLAGRADWLVCIEDCFPAEADLELTLPVSDAPPGLDRLTAPLFEAARAEIPGADSSWSSFARFKEPWYGLKIDPPDALGSVMGSDLSDVHFFASDPNVIDHAAEQSPDWDGETLVIRLARSGFSAGVPDTVFGVLVTERDGAGAPIAAVKISAPVIVAGNPAVEAETGSGLGVALLFAFLGGLLLNLMPCVFPVLSLKVLGFVEHSQQQPGGAARQGAAFATGVLVSFWVLGALLLVLRAAGESVGWGFQLQSPLFVGAMAVLFFLLALALLGAFEIGISFTRFATDEFVKVPSRTHIARNPTARSFGSGVLATIVATPCTAPFMGAALGWALLKPPAQTMLVFTALGAGMAAPYVALSLSPGLLDRLPAPGRWMETLKQLLAFPLLATVVWLAWVFGLQTGVNGLTGLLSALLLAGLAIWVGARWGGMAAQQPGKAIARATAIAIGGVALLILVRAAGSVPEPGSAPGAESATTAWPEWSPTAAGEVLREGRPLLIDFTAAWCLSCQVNERVVLNTATVRDAFRERGVTTLRADWTRRDAAITAALAELERSSVPVYALYSGRGGDPVLLPSVLTKEIVLEALETYVPVQR
jgi:thiol:disulfide interchange protein/DsbC/DsbD-like thiol-disulfide interchange protein